MEPFRFVHSARLQLDCAMRGTGAVPDPIRPILEDATLLAWDNVVESCLAESVDLLLLAGAEADLFEKGLRGATALLRGIERLKSGGIDVVIARTARESGALWPAGLGWPDGVIRLEGEDEFAVRRDGKLLALVHSVCETLEPAEGDTPRLLKLPSEVEPAFRIFVSPGDGNWSPMEAWGETSPPASRLAADYHATGGAGTSRAIAIGRRTVHDPGPPQAIRPLETGPRGCMFVCVDEGGQWKQSFIPTAPVRFESIHLTAGSEQTRDDLLLETIVALERLPRYPSDRVWLVAIDVAGAGPGLEVLSDERTREAFLAALHAEHGIRGVQVFVYAIRLNTAAPLPEPESGDELVRRFERRLAERVAHPQWALQRCLDESPLQDGPWGAPLAALLGDLDPGEVAAEARRIGREWLVSEEESSP